MKRIDVPLNSILVSCWHRQHRQIPAFVQVGANLHADINDWCTLNLSAPIVADRLYRSLTWHDAIFENYEATLNTTSIRLLFASVADYDAFVNRWLSGVSYSD